MAWSDAGQRLEALPTAGTGCNFVISDCPALSTPATIAGRCRYQSLIASGMIYVHISFRWCPSIACIKEQRSDGDRLLVELGVIRASMVHAASVLPAGRVGRSSPSLG